MARENGRNQTLEKNLSPLVSQHFVSVIIKNNRSAHRSGNVLIVTAVDKEIPRHIETKDITIATRQTSGKHLAMHS